MNRGKRLRTYTHTHTYNANKEEKKKKRRDVQQVTETMDKSLAQPYNRTTAFLEKKKKERKGEKKKEVLKIVEANSKSKATQRRLAEAKELFGKENHRKI